MSATYTLTPRPFTYAATDAAITDLHHRLAATRWPDDVNDDAWGWGIPLAATQSLCTYWREKFDWRAAEARLFAMPNFLLDIDGLDIHFIHARSPHENATPLIISHGWPGSVFEFLALIPRLTHPEQFGGTAADAFHVVAPSLQGYGFSPAATQPGMSQKAVGRRHARLMAALGYDRYIAQGGDWGSLVSQQTAVADPEHCIGLHLNMVQPIPPKDVADPMALVRPEEMHYFAAVKKLPRGRLRLLRAADHQTANPGLWPHGFARRLVRVGRREIPRLDRLPRRHRQCRELGRYAVHHQPVLVHEQHRVSQPLLPRIPSGQRAW